MTTPVAPYHLRNTPSEAADSLDRRSGGVTAVERATKAGVDEKLVRYIDMLRHECAYKGPCSDNGDGCTCSAEELDARHMATP